MDPPPLFIPEFLPNRWPQLADIYQTPLQDVGGRGCHGGEGDHGVRGAQHVSPLNSGLQMITPERNDLFLELI